MLLDEEINYLIFENKFDDLRSKIYDIVKQFDSVEELKKYILSIYSTLKKLGDAQKKLILRYIIVAAISSFGVNATISIVKDLPSQEQGELNSIFSQDKVEASYEYPRNSSPNLERFLKEEEGSAKHKGEPVLIAYSIGDGMITVGWGHAEKERHSQFKKGQKISIQQAEKLFQEDLAEAEDGLNTILNDWGQQGIYINVTQGMYDSMVSMIFNMGIGNFRKSEFIQLVKQNKLKEAKDRILTTGISKRYSGLTMRRQKEARMFNYDNIVKLVREFVRKEINKILA